MTSTPRPRAFAPLRLLATELSAGLGPVLVLLLLWQVAYLALPTNQFLRGPLQALGYLRTPESLSSLGTALVSTFMLLTLGYVIAILIAIGLAAAVTSHPAVSRAITPLAVALGVMPVIVITPLVIMLVGRGPATTVSVCVLITFFSCFVNLTAGMRSASRGALDLTRVLGGRAWRTLLWVRLPSAVPGLISASKLALPASLSGVILTEYIATGEGIGTFINLARANFRYTEMWAGILVIVLLSVLAYTILGLLEIWLTERYGADGTRATRPAAEAAR
ncbi:hypothetical protein BHE97_03480 [Aeromicrobium sp. PE09-221]|uniref:ABC transporter permease n=1 Tax=Aeromicrobium sp. PE09-221 TaxID=1898043 RepID=UPI000B3E88B2|nr:ABC transporter permease subunit [Aeromicrobium sp. PE09-221]OUZ11949.1 hypothetical protein BHE97_03480 [Aeromicrobium sp. PE09-221]